MQASLGDKVVSASTALGELTVVVKAADLLAVAQRALDDGVREGRAIRAGELVAHRDRGSRHG